MKTKEELEYAHKEKYLFINTKDDYSHAMMGQICNIGDNEVKGLTRQKKVSFI